MSKVENLASELCDELMLASSEGNLTDIKNTVVMLLEYVSCELRRNGNMAAALSLIELIKGFENSFPKT